MSRERAQTSEGIKESFLEEAVSKVYFEGRWSSFNSLCKCTEVGDVTLTLENNMDHVMDSKAQKTLALAYSSSIPTHTLLNRAGESHTTWKTPTNEFAI